MVNRKNYAITILDIEKIPDMNNIIQKYGRITLKSSSHNYFNTRAIDYEKHSQDMTFFQIEAEDDASIDETFKALTEELDQSIKGYAIRDEDTGNMLVLLEFVGKLDIKFDNIKIIKQGTYNKIDELKIFKTEFGMCKGYKPEFRPIEGKQLENIANHHESIYLLCNSQENLMNLEKIVSQKVLQIDPDFETEFRQFGGENPEFNRDINCLNLDSSSAIIKEIENKK